MPPVDADIARPAIDAHPDTVIFPEGFDHSSPPVSSIKITGRLRAQKLS
jgi:hypothetical protein